MDNNTKSLRDDNILFFIQKRAGFATAIITGLIAALNSIDFFEHGTPVFFTAAFSSVVLPLIIAVIFLSMSFINWPVIRLLQILFFLLLGFFGTSQGEAGMLIGPSFISLAVIYTFQYGFLKRRMLLKTLVFTAFYSGFVVYISFLFQDINIFTALNTLFINLLLFYLIWISFTPMLKKSEKQKEELRRELGENLVYVKLGRNTIGTVHNIRSKLATVRTYGQMLKTAREEEASRYLSKQEASITEIIGMLESILANVRAYGEEELKPCDLNAFLHISLEFKKADLDFKHGVRISTDFAPEASILGNPKDLVTIIDCLLDNAQEAITSQEEKCITLKTAAGQHTVKLTIEDNGPGLPFCSPCRHNSECLSCPEFHIGRTTKEKGSGLGITLVRNSIAKLNGDLRIESGPGRGTAVQIWFPRNRKHAKAAG